MRILNFYQLKIEIVSSGSKSGFQSDSQFAASPENVAFGFWHHFLLWTNIDTVGEGCV